MNTNKTENNYPNNTDFKEGYKLALQNARNHLEVAIVAKNISIGIANSHLILASEEAIKAEFTYRVHLNPEWLDEKHEFDKLFKNHLHKHKKSHEDELFGAFVIGFIDKLGQAQEQFKEKKISEEEIEEKSQLFYDEMKEWVNGVKTGQVPLETNERWWSHANFYKNLGFYIDIDKETGSWSGPFNVTSEEFEESRRIVEKMIRELDQYVFE